MPKFSRILLAGLVLLLILLAVRALVVGSEPIVWSPQPGTPHYAAATREILRSSVHNPLKAQEVRVIALSEDDLTTVANFALLRKSLDGRARAIIHGSRLDFMASIRLSGGSPSRYLNLKLVVDDAEPQAVIKQLKLGHLALPKPVVSALLWVLMRVTPLGRYGQLSAPLIREIRVGDGRLRVSLNWDRDAIGRMQDMVTDLASKERLLVYHNKLAEVLAQSEHKRFIGLGALTQPLFALALSRSENDANDAGEENRAVILVLAAFANGRNLLGEIAVAGKPAPLVKMGVLLNRRIDMAQHFMASAALAISGHRALADMVGLAKEINDTHSGSGFSFVDLAADRAGALFGKAAVKSAETARRVQDIMSRDADESLFMPTIRDLPEHLGPEEFERRFKTIESPEFQLLKQQIEERIAACPLYR